MDTFYWHWRIWPSRPRTLCTEADTRGHAHRNYTSAKTLYMKQADATYYPSCSQHWAIKVAKRAHSQVDDKIGFAQQNLFGLGRQFSGAKNVPGFCTVILKVVRSGVLDVQDSEWGREEDRWQREEKRWLREEERWLREEARWNTERKTLVEQCASLVNEIKVLKTKISQLQNEVKDEKLEGAIDGLTSLVHSLNTASALGTDDLKFSTPARISNAASSATNVSGAVIESSPGLPVTNFRVSIPVDLGTESTSIPELTERPHPEKSEDFFKTSSPAPKGFTEGRQNLKRGSEGDEVKLVQNALSKLGFYCGEEDMEDSTFSSGTDRAVRTWQATLGISEDGILTTDLLAKLFGEDNPSISGQGKAASGPLSSSGPSQAGAVGTGKAPASTSPTLKAQGLASGVIKAQGAKSPGAKTGASAPDFKAQASQSSGSNVQNSMPETSKSTFSSMEVSQTRVYLLGENRWEEPDRLLSKNGPSPAATLVGKRCISCQGQGIMVCTDCDGTGELNVEEQFLEWVEEGAKCPYCEGAGTLHCDVCNGKGVEPLS